ncbi:MAG: hypothetical protein RI901_1227 [Actinomycetota bacterium]
MSKKPWGYQPTNNRPEPDWDLNPQTESVRAGLARSGFGETSEALYLTSGFTYSFTFMAVLPIQLSLCSKIA